MDTEHRNAMERLRLERQRQARALLGLIGAAAALALLLLAPLGAVQVALLCAGLVLLGGWATGRWYP